MKTLTHAQPRFTCRVVRGWISVFGTAPDGAPRGLGAGHVATCEDCQAFFSACDELDLALKRDAARTRHDAPAGLEYEIMRAVKHAGPAPSPRAFRIAPLALAGAAACAMLAVVVFQSRTASSHPQAVDPDATAIAEQIIAVVPPDLFAQVQPQAQAILDQNPLQNEVAAAKSDARAAVRFLARNFLPDSSDEAARTE